MNDIDAARSLVVLLTGIPFKKRKEDGGVGHPVPEQRPHTKRMERVMDETARLIKSKELQLLATKVLNAEALEKKNSRKGPADVHADAKLVYSTQLGELCRSLSEFLKEVASERSRLELTRSSGRKGFRWRYRTTGTDGGKDLRALLPTLRKAFYPRGIIRPSKRRCSSDVWIGKAVDTSVEEHFKATAGATFLGFHAMISCEAECEEKLRGKTTPATFGEDNEDDGGKGIPEGRCDEDEEDRSASKEELVKLAVRRERSRRVFFDAIKTEFENKGILLVAVQIPICDPDQGVMSFVDAMGIVLATKRLLLLEIKTGYDYAYAHCRYKMEAPLEKIGCCAKNAHMLQVGWYFSTFKRRYGLRHLSIQDVYIFKVNATNTRVNTIVAPDGCEYSMNGEWFSLEPWFASNAEHINAKLLESANHSVKKKRKASGE